MSSMQFYMQFHEACVKVLNNKHHLPPSLITMKDDSLHYYIMYQPYAMSTIYTQHLADPDTHKTLG